MKRTVIRRVDCATNKRSCRTTRIYRQTGRPTDMQTNRHSDMQTSRSTDTQTNRHTDRRTSSETPVTRAELHNKNSHNDKVEPGERRSSRKVFIGKKPADYSVGRFNQASTAANTGNHTDRLRNKQTNSPQRAAQTVSLNPRSTTNVQTAQLNSSSLDKKPGAASGRSTTACRSRDKTRDSTRDSTRDTIRDTIRDTTRDTAHDPTRDSRRRLPSWLRKQWAFSKRLIYNLEIRNLRGLDRLIRNNHEQLRAARRAVLEKRIYDGENTQTDRLTDTQADTLTDAQTDTLTDNDGLFDRKIEYFDENFDLHD